MMTEIGSVADVHVLVHDGGLEGFLSAVFESFRLRLGVERVESRGRQTVGLFEVEHRVETDPDHAGRVLAGIHARGGSEMVSMVRAALLSEIDGIETVVWRYLSKVFGRSADASDRSIALFGGSWRNVLDPDMHATLDAANKTCHEAHRFQGFVRFSKAPDGSLFSVIAPDHDILPLLAPHFLSRFPGEPWSIFDERRGRCLRRTGNEAQILEVDRRNLPRDTREIRKVVGEGEEVFLDLWKVYYEAINIAQRANPKLLRRNLPVKYWRYLPERQVDPAKIGSVAR